MCSRPRDARSVLPLVIALAGGCSSGDPDPRFSSDLVEIYGSGTLCAGNLKEAERMLTLQTELLGVDPAGPARVFVNVDSSDGPNCDRSCYDIESDGIWLKEWGALAHEMGHRTTSLYAPDWLAGESPAVSEGAASALGNDTCHVERPEPEALDAIFELPISAFGDLEYIVMGAVLRTVFNSTSLSEYRQIVSDSINAPDAAAFRQAFASASGLDLDSVLVDGWEAHAHQAYPTGCSRTASADLGSAVDATLDCDDASTWFDAESGLTREFVVDLDESFTLAYSGEASATYRECECIGAFRDLSTDPLLLLPGRYVVRVSSEVRAEGTVHVLAP